MAELHNLLKRQLNKHFGAVGNCPPEALSFVNAVNDAYKGWDTDLKLLERSLDLSSSELLEANSELRAIFQAFPDRLFRLNSDGLILECKGGGASSGILRADELVGHSIQSIRVEGLGAKFQAALSEVLATRKTTIVEYSVSRDGCCQNFEARVVPLPDGQIIAIVRDITERKFAENALQLARFALDRSGDSVFWVEPDGTIIYANDAACKALGYSRSELLVHKLESIDASFHTLVWPRYWDELKTKQHFRMESTHRACDGREFPVEVLMNYLEYDGKEYACVFSRDISERRLTDDQLRDSGERLQRQQAMLVELARNKVLFGGDLSRSVREITVAAAETLDVATAGVWLLTSDRLALKCLDQYERAEGLHRDGTVIVGSDYPSYFYALERDRIIDAHDACRDPRTNEFAGKYLRPRGVTSMLDVPIVLGGQTVGVLSCEHVGPIRQWAADEQSFAGSVADLIGLALEASERRKTESALHIRTSAMNAATDQIVILDCKGRVEFVNPSFERETGQSLAEVQGKLPDFLCPEVAKPSCGCVPWNTVVSGTTWHGEVTITRKNRDVVVEDVTVTPIVGESGAIERFIAIKRNVTDKKAYEQELDRLAHHDPLTNLPNRLMFSNKLTECLAKSRHNGTQSAVLFLDLDRFKLINDSLGHSVGDMLIESVSARLTGCLDEAAMVSRMGGDEFTVILPNIADDSVVADVARNLIEELTAPFQLMGHELFVTVSIGASVYPADGADVETLVRNADSAMYRAKELGRNNFQFYTKAMNDAAMERVHLEASLRKAIEREEFELYYQPKVDLRTGRVVGAEALIRWQHPELGIVGPQQFIPLAEETGLIIPIGEWVMRTACKQAVRWHELGYEDLTVAVNLSARQLLQDDLTGVVHQILEETGLAPKFLDIELTESILMDSLDVAVAILSKFKSMGLKMSLDDFGTGYSSLTYLKRLPIDTVKIDRSFICDLDTNEDDAAITRAVIAMAQSLKLRVVAEGVESLDQLHLLRFLGCDEMQGYFVSKPVNARAFEAVLEEYPRRNVSREQLETA